MSRVHIESADELDRLAQEIDQVVDDVERESQSVKSELGSLGSTWRDAGYERFSSKYEASAEVISQFGGEARRFAEYLREHARLDREAEDYDA